MIDIGISNWPAVILADSIYNWNMFGKCLHTFTFNFILFLAASKEDVSKYNTSPNMGNVFTQILDRKIINFVTLYFILKMVINSIFVDNIPSHEW